MTQLTNLRGVVHGRTIELEQPLSVPDGEAVMVTITSVQAAAPNIPSRERLEAAAGALAGLDDEVDEFNRWYREARHAGYPSPPGEGIRRSAGAWADDAEDLDKYLEWNRQQRKQS